MTLTLSMDLGGTRLKAGVVDATNYPVCPAVWQSTKSPCSPEGLLKQVDQLILGQPDAGRLVIGFPGMVRAGRVLTAPLFWGMAGPGSPASPELAKAWQGYELEAIVQQRLGRPCLLVNDSDLLAAGIVSGVGLEAVITLGTGVGTAFVQDGRLSPRFELAHHTIAGELTYSEFAGDAALRDLGTDAWRSRVISLVDVIDRLVMFDRLYIGGGNARLLSSFEDPRISLVEPLASTHAGGRAWQMVRPEVPPESTARADSDRAPT